MNGWKERKGKVNFPCEWKRLMSGEWDGSEVRWTGGMDGHYRKPLCINIDARLENIVAQEYVCVEQ